jgi:transposase
MEKSFRRPIMNHRTYSEEFKKEAIRLAESSGKRVGEIERELGLPHGIIRKWQRRFAVNPVTNTLELSEVEQLKAEMRVLKRELEVARMERDILKKTVGIFSKDR